MRLLAIDPGNRESAYVIIDHAYRPVDFAKINNLNLRDRLWSAAGPQFDTAVVEMIASYGMAVGADVFETCVWIGRFHAAIECRTGHDPALIKRHPVKLHHCHSATATDSNITQALVDRFAPGERNHGKGTKAEPGFFHGFYKDIWQAMALAVYAMDVAGGVTP